MISFPVGPFGLKMESCQQFMNGVLSKGFIQFAGLIRGSYTSEAVAIDNACPS